MLSEHTGLVPTAQELWREFVAARTLAEQTNLPADWIRCGRILERFTIEAEKLPASEIGSVVAFPR